MKLIQREELKKKIFRLIFYNLNQENNYSFSSERLEELILNSVKLRLVSDVPVGAFLSSGIDSSLIVSMMQKYHQNLLKLTQLVLTRMILMNQ